MLTQHFLLLAVTVHTAVTNTKSEGTPERVLRHTLLQHQAMPYKTTTSCHHKEVLCQWLLLSCTVVLQALLGTAMECLLEACCYADTCVQAKA